MKITTAKARKLTEPTSDRFSCKYIQHTLLIYQTELVLDIDILNHKLTNRTFIRDIRYLKEVDSTNEYSRNSELGDNVLIIAEHQTSGKGRLGRRWESNKGENLTFTIRKRFDIESRKIQSINFFFSVYLLAAIDSYLNEFETFESRPGLELKWPNDILAGGKKLCGLLIEQTEDRNFSIGIGLNVNQRRFSKKFDSKTISLAKLTDKHIDRTGLLIHIIQIFDEHLHLLINEEYEKIFDIWLKNFRSIGKSVEVTYPDSARVRGKVVAVRNDGGIVLNIENSDKVFYSGDIHFKPICQ